MEDNAACTHDSRLVDGSSLVGFHFLGEMYSKPINGDNMRVEERKGPPEEWLAELFSFVPLTEASWSRAVRVLLADSENAVGWDLEESGSR